jgi:TnpA family transposase
MVRCWLLSKEDIKHINERRREHNRLGYAVQLCLLRHPGWPLKTDESAPPNLLNYVGQQLGADTAEFADYARRDNTRQEHQALIIKEYRFRQYGPAHANRMVSDGHSDRPEFARKS